MIESDALLSSVISQTEKTADRTAPKETDTNSAERNTPPQNVPEQNPEKSNLSLQNRLDFLVEKLPDLQIRKGLELCSGDTDFYLELLGDFTKLQVKKELLQYLDENHFKNYAIRVHGFKNNSYSIGAIKIGDLAFEMEKLSKSISLSEGEEKENEKAALLEMQQQLFVLYDEMCQVFGALS